MALDLTHTLTHTHKHNPVSTITTVTSCSGRRNDLHFFLLLVTSLLLVKRPILIDLTEACLEVV